MSLLFRAEMQRALLGQACPLCTLRSEDEVRYLHSLLREGLSNSSLLDRLSRAGGFCPEHAWALQRREERDWHDGLTNASFERPLLADAIEQLDQLPMSQRAVRRARSTQTEGPCPACQGRLSMERIRSANFAEALQDPELAQIYGQRKLGLCMPHVRMVWFEDMPDETRRFLSETQKRQLRGLLGELDQYLRKHHWHVKEKPLPDEADSWTRAVAVLAGRAMSDALPEIFGCSGQSEEKPQHRASTQEAGGIQPDCQGIYSQEPR